MIIKYKFFEHRLPWNQNTFYGWLIASIIGAVSSACAMLVHYSFLIFYVGTCDYHYSFAQHLGIQAKKLNAFILNGNHQSHDIKRLLCDMIKFHVMVQE